jgi:hypothetical protein
MLPPSEVCLAGMSISDTLCLGTHFRNEAHKMTLRRISPAAVALFGIATIAIAQPSRNSEDAQSNRDEFVTAGSQPSNVGDAKIAALAYHDSGAYDRDLAAVTAKANRWLARRVSSVS